MQHAGPLASGGSCRDGAGGRRAGAGAGVLAASLPRLRPVGAGRGRPGAILAGKGFGKTGIADDAGIGLSQAAYLLAARQIGDDALSGRIDWFKTSDRTFVAIDDNNEDGWAATAAWRHRLAPHADLIVEAQHISSSRPSRALAGDSPKQNETVLQTAMRLSF